METVIVEKISQLSFIDTNTSTTLIEQNASTDVDDEEYNSRKSETMQALATAIGNSMGAVELAGEVYTLEDIMDIELEALGLEYLNGIGVSVSGDLAIVTIYDVNYDDPYIFYIDSEFNLSE